MIVLGVLGAAIGWMFLVSACVGVYCVFFGAPPAPNAHRFFTLPFILIGDVLNTVARKRMLRLLRKTNHPWRSLPNTTVTKQEVGWDPRRSTPP